MRLCPICGEEYSEHPALSRRDNHTEICPMCGTIEALTDFSNNADAISKAEIYTVYSAEADITFIMEDRKNSTRVAGFYYGTSDDLATKQFYGKLMAEFE